MGGASSPPSRLASLAVATATLLSVVAYVAFSRELRHQAGDAEYARLLVGGFLREHGLSGVRLLRPVDVRGLASFGAWTASVILAGLALRRAAQGPIASRASWADTTVALLFASVVPTLLLATAWWPDGRGHLTSTSIILATLAFAAVAEAAGRWHRARRGAEPSPMPRHDGTDGAPDGSDAGRRWVVVFAVLLLPLIVAVWWSGIDSLRGFDAQADHLPRAARWLRLSRLSDESGELLTPYYPGDFLVVLRWVLVLGTDAYSFVPSLAAATLCVAAVYGLCRELGQARGVAGVAALCAASCTLLPYLATTAQADTAMTACLLLAVLLLMRWARTTDRRRGPAPPGEMRLLLGLGASLGLAVGIKYSALPPAAAIALAATCFAWRASYERTGRASAFNARTTVVSLATIAAPALLASGYWMLRNLVAHGNPLYPVATLGLPGVDMRTIIPIKPALVDSAWHRLTYPWVQWDFSYVYDDGIGAAFGAVAAVGFLVSPLRRWRRSGAVRLLWWLTLAAYILWIGTGSITIRFGLFPLLLTFCFVGELWRDFGNPVVKGVTLAAFAISVAATTRSMVVEAVYTSLVPFERIVPRVVDSLPPSRIFNATPAVNRYRLLGADYRHEVLTRFGPATPEDVRRSGARYLLLSRSQVAGFAPVLGATLVGRGEPYAGDTLSLWRVGP